MRGRWERGAQATGESRGKEGKDKSVLTCRAGPEGCSVGFGCSGEGLLLNRAGWGDVIKTAKVVTPNLYGVWTLGSSAIINPILQVEKVRVREVNNSTKVTQLSVAGLGIKARQ